MSILSVHDKIHDLAMRKLKNAVCGARDAPQLKGEMVWFGFKDIEFHPSGYVHQG